MSSAGDGEVSLDIDHTALIAELYERVLTPAHGFRSYPLGDEEACRCMGLDQVRRAADCVVLGEDAALQLGSPQRRSLSCVMCGSRRGLAGGRLWLAGSELEALRGRQASLGHIVVAERDTPAAGGGEGQASADSEPPGSGSLAGRLPGLMVRRLPGKLWLRVHARLLDRGLTLYALGQCLGAACARPGLSSLALDLVLFAGDGPSVDRIFAGVEPLVEAARLLHRKLRQLRWHERGWMVCDDLRCDACDDKAACDVLREVVAARQQRNGEVEERPVQ